jgi:hypothetical protein
VKSSFDSFLSALHVAHAAWSVFVLEVPCSTP